MNGWNLLQFYLTKYNYHLLVLDTIFKLDKRVQPPIWLIQYLKVIFFFQKNLIKNRKMIHQVYYKFI